MIHKFDRILFIFILNIFFTMFTNAQTVNNDSIVYKSDTLRYFGYDSQPSWLVTSAVSSVSGNELKRSFTSNLGIVTN